MKRLLLFIVGISFLFSCEYLNGPTTINKEITTDYLLNGNLDVYLTNNQIFRYKGKPGIETITIGNEKLSDFKDCFVMYVATGTTMTTTVSSAIIKLDDLEVLNTSDFSKNMGQHTFEVCNLTPTSVISVEVRGEPGSYIDIWIEGKLKELVATDKDGNIYKTVKIGSQVWMAENLKTTQYNDGTIIPKETDYNMWEGLTSGTYCWYNNIETYKNTYGAHYNWYALSNGKLCPTGWHVPTDSEWTILTDYLGGLSVAGGKLKEIGTTHWLEPNTGARDEVGFKALPSGLLNVNGFSDLQRGSHWFSSTECGPNEAWGRYIDWNNEMVGLFCSSKSSGYSIRCVMNN
jgi:uncharacterized protein (TIGR02145 family)